MTVKMIVDRAFSYRGHGMKIGQEFDCDPEHVAVFERIGHARRATAAASQAYLTRDMAARPIGRRKESKTERKIDDAA